MQRIGLATVLVALLATPVTSATTYTLFDPPDYDNPANNEYVRPRPSTATARSGITPGRPT